MTTSEPVGRVVPHVCLVWSPVHRAGRRMGARPGQRPQVLAQRPHDGRVRAVRHSGVPDPRGALERVVPVEKPTRVRSASVSQPRKEVANHMRDVITTTHDPNPLRLPSHLPTRERVDVANPGDLVRTTHGVLVGHRQAQVIAHRAIARVCLAIQGAFTFVQPGKPSALRVTRQACGSRHASHVTRRYAAHHVTTRRDSRTVSLLPSVSPATRWVRRTHRARRTV